MSFLLEDALQLPSKVFLFISQQLLAQNHQGTRHFREQDMSKAERFMALCNKTGMGQSFSQILFLCLLQCRELCCLEVEVAEKAQQKSSKIIALLSIYKQLYAYWWEDASFI